MKNIFSLLLVILILSLGVPIRAQERSSTEASRDAYESGVKHYDLAEFDESLEAFKDAYRAKSDPAFLFNIAQCLRKLNKLDEAATFYRTYLRRAPDASNRIEVERRLRDIENQLAITPPSLPPGVYSPPPSPHINLAPQLPQPASKMEKHPLYTKWWFWTVVGTVAAGATATIIILARQDPTSIPSSGLGYQRALP